MNTTFNSITIAHQVKAERHNQIIGYVNEVYMSLANQSVLNNHAFKHQLAFVKSIGEQQEKRTVEYHFYGLITKLLENWYMFKQTTLNAYIQNTLLLLPRDFVILETQTQRPYIPATGVQQRPEDRPN